MKMEINDSVAVITGAASGIGQATALALAERGCHLALVDRDEIGLHKTAKMAQVRPITISKHFLDLSQPEAIEALPQQVLVHHERVNILINNAGVALVGSFEELSLEEIRWLFEINFMAVVGMTKAFLPLLRRQPQSQIVNISSVFGIMAPPHQSAYASAKFAVRGFSESLRHELEGSTVGVTVVHPGGIKTEIASSARVAAVADPVAAAEGIKEFSKALRLSPEKAADEIVHAIETRRKRLLIGSDARLIDILQRLLPVSYWSVLRRLI